MIRYIRILLICVFSLEMSAGSEPLSNIDKGSKDYQTLSNIDVSSVGKMILAQYVKDKNLGEDILLTYHCRKKSKFNCELIRLDSKVKSK